MSRPYGFEPVARSDARVLILGSMPGQLSLQKQQYYAHPRNVFWRIMGELFGFIPDSSYQLRLQSLIKNGLALWDVLGSCDRLGSLDSAIDEQSIVVNDFKSFYHDHPDIGSVFFNGMKSERAYLKYVLPHLAESRRDLFAMRLPSTSPANARLALVAKIGHWQIVHQHAARLTQ